MRYSANMTKKITLPKILATVGFVLTLAACVSAQDTQKRPSNSFLAQLEMPRHNTGTLNIGLRLSSELTIQQEISSSRDNQQDCSFGPLLRVLRVGTREVVYPPANAEKGFCAQDMKIGQLAKDMPITYQRELELPAGDYMVEGWLIAQVDGGDRIKIPAQPRRISIE